MDNTTLAQIQRTVRKVREMEPVKLFRLTTDYGDIVVFTEKQLAKLKLVPPTLDDVGVGYDEPLTSKLLTRIGRLAEKGVRYEDEYGNLYARAEVEKAKGELAIVFDVLDFDDARLTADGRLEIGCQNRSLDEWNDDSIDYFDPNRGYGDVRRAARDALLPVLREKLAELKRAAPRKRAKKAA